jgi:RNA-directed DNA polymerase
MSSSILIQQITKNHNPSMLIFTPPPPLFTLEELDEAMKWLRHIRKDYSPHNDIWDLTRKWNTIKHDLLKQLNNGSYQFDSIERLEFNDATISLWCSKDMIALKLIAQALGRKMGQHIPKSCYHIKGHGGLKQAVQKTHEALPQYQYVLRSDIKGYYESIDFNILLTIIEFTIKHPILLTLIRKACHRIETRGGIFYEYSEKGIPMGSPLSPLLGAIALIPLDMAMQNFKDIFYLRFMDDWVVLTKSKTALRKVIKRTHQIVQSLKLQLHPMKTFIGKISHGFNFLAYYFDTQKILPSLETLRRFHERATALYERPQTTKTVSRRYRKSVPDRDISLYQVDEKAPCDEDVKNLVLSLEARASKQPDILKRMRLYTGQWARWLKCGLSTIKEFETSVQTLLPSLFSCWSQGAQTMVSGVSH